MKKPPSTNARVTVDAAGRGQKPSGLVRLGRHLGQVLGPVERLGDLRVSLDLDERGPVEVGPFIASMPVLDSLPPPLAAW
ncbi:MULTISPECIES: hypothetical protein [unclassified Streptomyces]|uniref:hypothetical protein n=1 Tax=unclassified Streptomyces TaxID=2593676 RepID=UPI00365D5536